MCPADSDFLDELVAVFAAEAADRLSVVDQRLLELEREADPQARAGLLTQILRELHTLKGSAGAVDMADVGRVAHGLETLLGGTGPDAVPDGVYRAAFEGLDALRALVGGGDGAGIDVEALLARLADPAAIAAAGAGVRTGPASSPPVAATARSEPGPARAGTDESVRLATSKLDSLMARVGELVVTRIGTEERAQQARELSRRVAEWEDDWGRARPRYRRIAAALGEGRLEPAAAEALIEDLREILPALEQGDARLGELARQLGGLRQGIDGDERRLGQVTGELEEEVRRTRMLPVATIVDPLHRVVRDLARDLGREVVLQAAGAETEVDRSVLDQLRGPLTHLIRNSVDHGIEPPDARDAAGKGREGTIRLTATERGGTLRLVLEDDGAGIDATLLRERAVEAGLVTAEQAGALTERESLRLVFRSGLSSRASVTGVSGRGVGLDAVRDAVERLHGTVDVASEPGRGSRFTLSVPLSVATTQCLLVGAAGQRFCLPVATVGRIVAVDPGEVRRAQGREILPLDDGPVVVARLEDVLQLTSRDRPDDGRRGCAVVVGTDERRIALLVDDLLATQDVVVTPLPRPFVRVRHAAGATVLATGEVVVVLNAADLIRTAALTAVRLDSAAVGREAAAPVSRTIMVVDDSIVTRMLEKSILEAAGYRVRVAADGAEAWRSLEADPVDLIVSDINMPNMDGLALTARVRAHAHLRETPVVLVTSLDAPEDHARAVEVGADAYIVKSSFSQEGLLETVGRLV
jgi:two-component system chemotaxis sensor kinase CheA